MKIHDLPTLEMLGSRSCRVARQDFPEYAQWMLPGVLIQLILRTEYLTRRARNVLLEALDATLQILIDRRHDGGRLADRREKGKGGQPPRPVSGWSSDQLMRFVLLALVLRERIAQSPDDDINLANEGDKPEEQFFALIRQSLHNYDTDERFKARVVRALLELLHSAPELPREPNPKHCPVAGAIAFANDPEGAIDLPFDDLTEVRQMCVDFYNGRPEALNQLLDGIDDQLEALGGQKFPDQSADAGSGIIAWLLRGFQWRPAVSA